MNDSEVFFVTIMPWASLQRRIKIGKTVFSPWGEVRPAVTDDVRKDTIQHYLDSFVGHLDKPVDTVAICSYEGREFHEPSENELSEMRGARDILVFSVVCPKVLQSIQGCSIGLCSAERFQVVGQQLKPGDKTVYMKAGHNLTLGQFKVHKPISVGGGYQAPPDENLLNALDGVFAGGVPGELRTVLLRSLEWFRLAHVEADQVSELSRIVMMATAFETLLGITAKETDKSMFFAKQVDRRLRTSNSICSCHPTRKEVLTKAAWWAYDFYKLRNKIVHGDEMRPGEIHYDIHASQKDVADFVLCQILFQILFEHGCVKDLPDLSGLTPTDLADYPLPFGDFGLIQEVLDWVAPSPT